MRPRDIFCALQSQESVEGIFDVQANGVDNSLAKSITFLADSGVPLTVTDKVGLKHAFTRPTTEMWLHIKFNFRSYLRLSSANPVVSPFDLLTIQGSSDQDTFKIQVNLYGSGIPGITGFEIVNPNGYNSPVFQAPNILTQPVTFDIRLANNDLRIFVDGNQEYVDGSYQFLHDLKTLRMGFLDTAFETEIYEILIAYEDTRGYRLHTAYPAEQDDRNRGFTGPEIPYFEFNSTRYDVSDINILAHTYYAVDQNDAVAFKFNPLREYRIAADVSVANLITVPTTYQGARFRLFSANANYHRDRGDIPLQKERHQIVMDETYDVVSPGETETLGFKVTT